MAEIGATQEEAAHVLGVGIATLKRYLANDAQVREVWDKGMAEAKTSVRRWQMEAARKGNPAILIWLGKQMLGQRDTPESTDDPRDTAKDIMDAVREIDAGFESPEQLNGKTH